MTTKRSTQLKKKKKMHNKLFLMSISKKKLNKIRHCRKKTEKCLIMMKK